MKKIILCAALAASVLCTGCVAVLVGGAVAAGAGTVAYVDGELKSAESVPLERAEQATRAAFKDLQYGVVGQEGNLNLKRIIARTGSDKKITVTLERESNTLTKVGIRVGVFGDQALSMSVLDKIRLHL